MNLLLNIEEAFALQKMRHSHHTSKKTLGLDITAFLNATLIVQPRTTKLLIENVEPTNQLPTPTGDNTNQLPAAAE